MCVPLATCDNYCVYIIGDLLLIGYAPSFRFDNVLHRSFNRKFWLMSLTSLG